MKKSDAFLPQIARFSQPKLGFFLRKTCFWGTFLLFLPIFLTAQSPLDGYIEQGLRSNRAMQLQDFDLEKNREAIRQARALFQPSVNFAATYTMAAGGRSLDFPIGDLLNPVYSTLNQLTASNNFPQVENAKINFLASNFQETKIKFAQPIFNSDLKHNLLIQKELGENSTLKKAALAHELRGEIRTAYLKFGQAVEAEKIWSATVELLDELLKLNQALVKNNVATRDVIASAEYEKSRAENELFKIKQAQKTAKSYFFFLINEENPTAEIRLDSSLWKGNPQTYNLEEMLAFAKSNRLEIKQLAQVSKIYGLQFEQQNDHRKLPSAYLGGELGFQGFGYHFFDNQLYGLAQIGLNYTLYDAGQNRSKMQQTRLESEKIRLQIEDAGAGIAMQVRQAFFAWETAFQSIESAQKREAAALEIFKIIRAKYRQQQALPIEMLDAETRLTNAREQLMLAKFEVLLRENELRQAAGFDN